MIINIHIFGKLIFALIISVALAQACPTCVGRIETNSPAFFADEFYQAQEAESIELNQEISAQEPEAIEQLPASKEQ